MNSNRLDDCLTDSYLLIGGSWLSLLKYWIAQFSGCDDRLAWLLSEYGKPSQDSPEPANTLKETVQDFVAFEFSVNIVYFRKWYE